MTKIRLVDEISVNGKPSKASQDLIQQVDIFLKENPEFTATQVVIAMKHGDKSKAGRPYIIISSDLSLSNSDKLTQTNNIINRYVEERNAFKQDPNTKVTTQVIPLNWGRLENGKTTGLTPGEFFVKFF
jgi:hypothetical protein